MLPPERCGLVEGLWLMGVGMTTVFGFLLLLVASMMASAAFFERFGDAFETPVAAPRPAVAAGPGPEIAVILAAIEAHRAGGDA